MASRKMRLSSILPVADGRLIGGKTPMGRNIVGVLACVAAAVAAGCGAGGTGGAAPPADPTADTAAEVLRVHARLDRIEFPKGRDQARLRGVLDEINGIDTSRCPADYRAAYAQFAAAAGAVVDYRIETGAWENVVATGVEAFARGFLGDPFGVAREDRERRRQLQGRIADATANYQRTVAKYRK